MWVDLLDKYETWLRENLAAVVGTATPVPTNTWTKRQLLDLAQNAVRWLEQGHQYIERLEREANGMVSLAGAVPEPVGDYYELNVPQRALQYIKLVQAERRASSDAVGGLEEERDKLKARLKRLEKEIIGEATLEGKLTRAEDRRRGDELAARRLRAQVRKLLTVCAQQQGMVLLARCISYWFHEEHHGHRHDDAVYALHALSWAMGQRDKRGFRKTAQDEVVGAPVRTPPVAPGADTYRPDNPDYVHAQAPVMGREDGIAAIVNLAESAGLIEPEPSPDVHTEHCCARHGCKYSDADCAVVSGQKKQAYPCESCDHEARQNPVLAEAFGALARAHKNVELNVSHHHCRETLTVLDALLPLLRNLMRHAHEHRVADGVTYALYDPEQM